MTGVDPTNPPEENVGPVVNAQVDGIDATPGYWTEQDWQDDRSVEVEIPEGQDIALPLSWCSGAGVLLIPDEDAVQVVIALPDAPVAFTMTLRRVRSAGPMDGRLILEVPEPSAPVLPAPLYQLAPGTYQVRDAVRTEDLT